MLQFHRSRNTGESIENVIFYGDTHEYVRLTDELEKLDLNTSLINVPPQIHGHENLEFSLYANAIGAMFKRNRETEKINLLDTDLGAAIKRASSGGGHSDSAGTIPMLAMILGAGVILGGTWGVMTLINAGIKHQIKEIREYIDDPATQKKLKHREKLLGIRSNVNAYHTKMVNAHDAFYSKPVINQDKYETIQAVLDKTAEDLDLSFAVISTPSYSSGAMGFTVIAAGSKEMVQKLPSMYIDNLLDDDFSENKGYYENASYNGYTVTVVKDEAGNVEEDKETVSFSVALAINGRESAYKPEKKD